MSVNGPVYLRWREAGATAPSLERFASLDEALDAVEARWETLQAQAPQVLDARKVLIVSTEDLLREMAADPEG